MRGRIVQYVLVIQVVAGFLVAPSLPAADVSSVVELVSTQGKRSIYLFDNKLYFGNGSTGGGQAYALYYDPASDRIVNEGALPEEEVTRFRTFDNQLYIAGGDREGTEDTFMYRKEATGWRGYGDCHGTEHHFDVYNFNNTFFVNGYKGTYGVTFSKDGGATWSTPGGLAVTPQDGGWEFFEFNGTLYHVYNKFPGDTIPWLVKYTGSTFTAVRANAPADLAITIPYLGTYAGVISHAVHFNGELAFYNLNNYGNDVFVLSSVEPFVMRRCGLPAASNRTVWDLKARSSGVYALVTSGVTTNPSVFVYQSTNLHQWAEVFHFSLGVPTAPAWGMGMEEFNGDFYITSPLGLLRVPRPAPPVIDSVWADPDTVTLPDPVVVSAIAFDPDDDPLMYTWTRMSGPGAVAFSPGGTSTSFMSTATFSAAGAYVLRVVVSDGVLNDTGAVSVVVNPAITTVTESWTGTAGSPWPARWTKQGSALSCSIQTNRGQMKASSTAGATLMYVNTQVAEDVEQVVLCNVNNNSTRPGFIARRTDADNDTYYGVETSTSTSAAYIFRMVDGARVNLGTVGTILSNVDYRMRFKVQDNGAGGTALKFKLWKASVAEPAAWSREITDTTARLQGISGRFGLRGSISIVGSRRILYDDYTATVEN